MRLAALAAAALLLSACSAEAPPAKPTPAPAPAAGAAPAAAPAAYPLKTCVVTGEELGGMGEPFVYMHEGIEVRFCCGNCVKEFKKDPKKYLAILEAARKK